MMAEGSVDAMSGLAFRRERAEYMEYIWPTYYQCATVFYVPSKPQQRLRVYEDLYRYEIGFIPDSAYFSRFDQDEKIKKVGVSNEQQLIGMLGRGRLQAFIGTDCQADYEIAQSPFRDQIDKAEYRPGNRVELHLAISKRSPFFEQRALLGQALEGLVHSGELRTLSQPYFR